MLCLQSLRKILDKNLNADRIDAAYITTAERKFTKISRQKIDKAIRELKKK